jgi:hypothetical protein
MNEENSRQFFTARAVARNPSMCVLLSTQFSLRRKEKREWLNCELLFIDVVKCFPLLSHSLRRRIR